MARWRPARRLVGLDVAPATFVAVAGTVELLFGQADLVGHLPVYGVFLALLAYSSYSPRSRWCAGFLRCPRPGAENGPGSLRPVVRHSRGPADDHGPTTGVTRNMAQRTRFSELGA